MDLINPRLGTIRKGINTVRTLLKNYRTVTEADPFERVMNPLLAKAEETLQMLECNFARMEKRYIEFIAIWNETPQTLSMQLVFTILNTFVSDLKVRTKSFQELELTLLGRWNIPLQGES